MIVVIRQYGNVLTYFPTNSRDHLTAGDVKRAIAQAEKTPAVTIGYYDVALTTMRDRSIPSRDRDAIIEVR